MGNSFQTLFLIILFGLIGCASQKTMTAVQGKNDGLLTNSAPNVSTSQGDNDGSSFEKAIIVKSIDEEYKWIRQHYPGSRVTMQALVNQGKKPYDILTTKLSDGSEKKFYFDINKFFGKF